MDYSTPQANNLNKYQWDLIHNPASVLFSWLEDEGEGAYGSANYSNIVEGIRCSRYSGSNTLNIKNLDAQIRQSTLTWNYPSLLDNEPYGNFTLAMDNDNIEVVNTDVIFAKGNKVSIGESGKQINFSVRNKNLYDSPELAEKLKDYLNIDKAGYIGQVEDLLIKMDRMADISIQIQNIPDCWFSEISNNRRIEYLKKLSSKADDNINYIIKLVNTVKKENIASFFAELGKTTLFYTFRARDNISFDNYTAFIKSATLLYYQQYGLKDKLLDLPYNKLFVNQAREGSLGASISNSFAGDQDVITITGNVTVVIGTTNPYGVTVPSGTKAFQAYSYSVGYCDLIGLELNSDFGNLKASVHNDIVPLPAFYFDWMKTNLQRQSNLQAIDVTVTLLTLAVGIGELQAVSMIGRFLFAVKMTGVIKSSIDLVLLNQKVSQFIETSGPTGNSFLEVWPSLSLFYNLATFDLRNINMNRDFFNDIEIAWNVSKINLQKEFEPQLFKDVEALMLEIEKELQK
jgi:hypothetical protein